MFANLYLETGTEELNPVPGVLETEARWERRAGNGFHLSVKESKEG